MIITYLILTPFIIIISLAVTSMMYPIQVLKEKYELDYHRNDKGIFVFFISKVLNCVRCLTGHLTYTLLFIFSNITLLNLIIIPVLVFINMWMAVKIENKIYDYNRTI